MINVIFTNDGYTQQHDVVEIDNVNIDEHPSFVEACEQKDIVNNTMITLTWRSSDYHGLYVLKLGTFPLYKAYLEIDGKKYTFEKDDILAPGENRPDSHPRMPVD